MIWSYGYLVPISRIYNSIEISQIWNTVSVRLQPWAHWVLFYNMSFWVRFNSKNPTKRGLFDQKMGFYSRKSPKTGLLKRGEVIFKSGAVLERIRYFTLCYYWNRIEQLDTIKLTTKTLVHTITRYSQIQNNWGPPTAIRLSIELEFFGVISIWQALKCHWNLNSLVLRRILCETYKCSCCLGIKKCLILKYPNSKSKTKYANLFSRFSFDSIVKSVISMEWIE